MNQKIILFNLLITFSLSLFSQNYVKVIIKDTASGEPLFGAAIIENGTTNGAYTDEKGKAEFSVSKSGEVRFTVKYVGYAGKDYVIAIPQKESFTTLFLSSEGQQLEEVTISSVRTNSRIEEIPTRIEVLGNDDLSEENGIKPGNIISLLGDIAGIQMQQISASTGNVYARIQGLNGRYTQLLRDGMPLFGGLAGSFGIMQIPPLDLKQIEIIKGSVSTLYGAGAIGGIINLVSKDPSYEPELSFTLNQSTLHESNLNGYLAMRKKNIGFTLFEGQSFQKEIDIDKDGLSDVPKSETTVIHPKLIFYFNPKSELSLSYSGTMDKRTGGDLRYFISPENDSLYHIRSTINRNNSDAKWIYDFSKKNKLTLKFSQSHFTQKLETKFYNADVSQTIFASEISLIQQWPKMDFVEGLNFNGDAIGPVLGIEKYKYQTLGAFIQNTFRINEKFILESGLRNDYHSKFGFFTLPRTSILYKINSHYSARINGGMGYIIPNTVTYVNPETELNIISTNMVLKPETSKGINADINYHRLLMKKLDITFNQAFFLTTISQPIYDSSSVNNRISLTNAGKDLQTNGLQTYSRLKFNQAELYLGYVFTSVTKKYDKKYPYLTVTPKYNFSSTFFYEPDEEIRFGFESSLIAGQLDQNYNPVKNYFLFAAMAQYSFWKMTMILNCENLFDFRQNKFEKIYDGSINNPGFHKLWAPIDGRVINFSVKWKL